ncbi:MAG TPA: hypothetical protein VF773_07115 [Verrucomicrobiae bacterium]
MKTGPLFLAAAVSASALTGCTHVAKSRTKTAAKLHEHSRAFTTAIVDTLQLQPTDQRDPYTILALDLAKIDQRIEDLPLKPIAVEPLLASASASSTNLTAAQHRAARRAASALEVRRSAVDQLLATERSRTDQLIAFGEKFEEERNQSRLSWFKRISLSTLLLGSFIALAIFFPAAIPILGRILAWLVGKIPALAGTLGVVSVNAFDAVVKGIERTRTTGSIEKLGNQLTTGEIPLADLKLNLSREMDAAHKALVRRRKSSLNLN